jgi:ketosteroid isomerase-like protein
MSRENVELARWIYEAFNHGDWEGLMRVCWPDIAVQRAAGAGTVHGYEAVRRLSAPDAFESQQLDPREFIEHRHKLLVTLRARARGATSGIDVEQTGFHVLTFRDRKISRVEVYFDKSDALNALYGSRVERSDDVS